MSQKKVIYWDACIFLHLFRETPEYIDALRHNLGQATSEECVIATSSVTLAEVYKVPGEGVLPLDQRKLILGFFKNPYVEMWQADRGVCEKAHYIMNDWGTLKPMDAIHVATALAAEAHIMLTTDKKMYNRSGLLLSHDGKIDNLRIVRPTMGEFLPLWKKENEGGGQAEAEAGQGM